MTEQWQKRWRVVLDAIGVHWLRFTKAYPTTLDYTSRNNAAVPAAAVYKAWCYGRSLYIPVSIYSTYVPIWSFMVLR